MSAVPLGPGCLLFWQTSAVRLPTGGSGCLSGTLGWELLKAEWTSPGGGEQAQKRTGERQGGWLPAGRGQGAEGRGEWVPEAAGPGPGGAKAAEGRVGGDDRSKGLDCGGPSQGGWCLFYPLENFPHFWLWHRTRTFPGRQASKASVPRRSS